MVRGLAPQSATRQFEGMTAQRRLSLAACFFAPLCMGPLPGHWTKPGVDAASAQREYRQCLAEAQEAVKTTRAIDRDILATHSEDWRRAGTLDVEIGIMRSAERAQADSVLARCMREKGYRRVPANSPLGDSPLG
jgi:hypothetical protein